MNLYVFYVETHNIVTQYLTKNNLVICLYLKILLQYRNLLMYLYDSNDDICKIKSILKSKNTSENARGRGINADNSPTETHPPL